jgi:hypothetical protein
LECLEERVVPDGASGNLGIVTNGGVNFQGGITLVPNPPSADLSGIAVGTFASPFNASGALNLAQQGPNLPSNVPNFTQTAFGFGSGAQPNQPWVPNAYNLGLANQQSAYPSMSDFGFQAAPWIRRVAHFQEKNAQDAPDEQLTPPRTFLAVHPRAETGDLIDQILADDEDDDASEEQADPDSVRETRPIPLVPHAATVTEDGDVAAGRAALSPRETAVAEGKMAFTQFSEIKDSRTLFSDDGQTKPAVSRADDLFVMDDGEEVAPVLHPLDLSSTLVLAMLTPAQFMALLTEFPAPAAPREDREKVELLAEKE